MEPNGRKSEGASEIEVTPKMLSAGSRALEAHYLGDAIYDLTDPTLREVFLAMYAARHPLD
jgi:hypothetical protein